MSTVSALHQNAKARTVRKTFSRETSISIDIKTEPSIIWALLTNASDYPRWNSTVLGIDGTIATGETIKLRAALDPKRIFKLKVKKFIPEQELVWGDAMGNRVYTISKKGNSELTFSMDEKIGGPLFPLFAKMIPSFDKPFEQFAADLKREAEAISGTK